MAKTYRAGIAGCGSIARLHARGYEGVDQIEIVAVADPVRESAERFGDEYGVARRYEDYRQMRHRQHLHLAQIARAHDHCCLRPPPQGGAVRKTHGD